MGHPMIASGTSIANTDPAQWPSRTQTDQMLQQVGETAQLHNVSLRTISASHRTASAQTWGSVSLDVAVAGTYTTLKAWQAEMQQRFPTLAIQSLRLLGNPSSQGGLEAQMLWVLHVRD